MYTLNAVQRIVVIVRPTQTGPDFHGPLELFVFLLFPNIFSECWTFYVHKIDLWFFTSISYLSSLYVKPAQFESNPGPKRESENVAWAAGPGYSLPKHEHAAFVHLSTDFFHWLDEALVIRTRLLFFALMSTRLILSLDVGCSVIPAAIRVSLLWPPFIPWFWPSTFSLPKN